MPKIVLASSSPRRQELLRSLGWAFEVRSPDVDESHDSDEPADRLVERLAVLKARSVASDLRACWVIGSDTVVELDGRVLGKPSNIADACSMLTSLSGRWHRVYSGVAVMTPTGRLFSGFDVTKVHVAPLDEAAIVAYGATGEPLDKAGGYAVQGLGALMVDRIEGNYTTVVGLPMALLAALFEKAGVTRSRLWGEWRS